MSSGIGRWLACVLIATGCDSLMIGELESQGPITQDGQVAIDDTMPPPPPDMAIEGPADQAIEGPVDAPTEGGPLDAPMEGGPGDAMTDGGISPTTDAGTSDGGGSDGGDVPGDGGIDDAPGTGGGGPGGGFGGGNGDDELKSFYTCSTGHGASMVPLLIAILALRRRRR